MTKKTLFSLYASLWALLTWALTTTPQIVVSDNTIFQTILMIGAHFPFFGIQAVLLKLSGLDTFRSIVVASLYGALIELHQLSVPGRSGDIFDWILDTLGAITLIFFLKKLKLPATSQESSQK